MQARAAWHARHWHRVRHIRLRMPYMCYPTYSTCAIPHTVHLLSDRYPLVQEYLRRLFSIGDTDSNGFLSRREMQDLLAMSRFGFDSAEVTRVVNLYDEDGDGQVPWP